MLVVSVERCSEAIDCGRFRQLSFERIVALFHDVEVEVLHLHVSIVKIRLLEACSARALIYY